MVLPVAAIFAWWEILMGAGDPGEGGCRLVVQGGSRRRSSVALSHGERLGEEFFVELTQEVLKRTEELSLAADGTVVQGRPRVNG